MRTLPFYLAKGAVKAILACALLYIIVVTGMDPVPPAATRPDAVGSPVEMLKRFDCWNGATAPGVIPGHVIIRLEGTDVVRHGGQHLTDVALNQVLGITQTNHEVFGFCS